MPLAEYREGKLKPPDAVAFGIWVVLGNETTMRFVKVYNYGIMGFIVEIWAAVCKSML